MGLRRRVSPPRLQFGVCGVFASSAPALNRLSSAAVCNATLCQLVGCARDLRAPTRLTTC